MPNNIRSTRGRDMKPLPYGDDDPKAWKQKTRLQVEANEQNFRERANRLVTAGVHAPSLLGAELLATNFDLLTRYGYDVAERDFVPPHEYNPQTRRFTLIHESRFRNGDNREDRLSFALAVATSDMLRSLLPLTCQLSAAMREGKIDRVTAVRLLVKAQTQYAETFFPKHTYEYYAQRNDAEGAIAVMSAYCDSQISLPERFIKQNAALKDADGTGRSERAGLRSDLPAEIWALVEDTENSPPEMRYGLTPFSVHKLPYLALSAVRKNWHTQEAERAALRLDSSDSAELAEQKSDLEEWEERQEFLAIFQEAEVSKDQQEALALRFAGGLSESEIAESLGIHVGTVRSRQQRGLQKLERYFRTQYAP